MNQIVFFGDSNTYGYDPRGTLGMRYSEAVRWTTLVQKALAERFVVVEEGLNGRQLPNLPRDERLIWGLTAGLGVGDYFVTMLGTNDVLLTDHPNAEIAIGKMERLLQFVGEMGGGFEMVIIAPPYIAAGSLDESMEPYFVESVKMNRGFARLCGEYGVRFVDAGEWDVPMAFDGVHFSEEGHRVFAERFLGWFEKHNTGNQRQ